MKEGLIALNYECSKCNERMGLYERKSAVLDGDFEWVCSTITSQNIYGRTPMILLKMRPSRVFVKIRCHAVVSTRKRSAQGFLTIALARIFYENKLLGIVTPILVPSARIVFQIPFSVLGCRFPKASFNKSKAQKLI
ncbi:hypothetical protein TNCV_3175881 [Trichonephila clavipes]|nr:hypothetical protein TNCV_3175881 [Trichonephila clavipes]